MSLALWRTVRGDGADNNDGNEMWSAARAVNGTNQEPTQGRDATRRTVDALVLALGVDKVKALQLAKVVDVVAGAVNDARRAVADEVRQKQEALRGTGGGVQGGAGCQKGGETATAGHSPQKKAGGH